MSQKHFKQIVRNMPDNPGAEILRYGWRKENILSLGQGEGSDPTPDFVINAANQAMVEGKTFYGPVLGQPALREEISQYYKRIFDADIASNQVFITGSGTTAMHLSLSSILEEGDEVVAVTPIWKNLLGAVHLAQAKTIQVPLESNGDGWFLDLDKLFAAVNEKTKAILIVTPSNPTGWVLNKADMKRILEFAREQNIWIVSDEVYNRSVYGQTYAPSFNQFTNDDDKVFTINSFSKSWAMTGWRMGWIVGTKIAEAKIKDVALYNNLCPPTATQYGAIAALEQGEDFLASQIAMYKSNRDLMMERLGAMGDGRVHLAKPEATFYGFFKVDGEPDCIALTKRFIDEAQLLLSPGCAFGTTCKGYIRMCFAVSEERLNEAFDRMEKVI